MDHQNLLSRGGKGRIAGGNNDREGDRAPAVKSWCCKRGVERITGRGTVVVQLSRVRVRKQDDVVPPDAGR